MSTKPKEILYVDTMVVIEATRTKCWKAILNRYDVRTVTTVEVETQSGARGIGGYVKVDGDLFRNKVKVSEVSCLDLAEAMERSATLVGIDAGERDLLAYAVKQPEGLILTTADRAAVRCACELGMAERLISLEELAQACGQKPELKDHYSKSWLAWVKLQMSMGM